MSVGLNDSDFELGQHCTRLPELVRSSRCGFLARLGYFASDGVIATVLAAAAGPDFLLRP